MVIGNGIKFVGTKPGMIIFNMSSYCWKYVCNMKKTKSIIAQKDHSPLRKFKSIILNVGQPILELVLALINKNPSDALKAGKGIIEGVNILGNDKVEHRAFVLLFNGIRRAIMQLIWNYRSKLHTDDPFTTDLITIRELTIKLENSILELEVEIDEFFFRYPENLSFLLQFRPQFETWLIALGVAPPDALAILRELPLRFCIELEALYAEKEEYFSLVRDSAQEKLPISIAVARYKYNEKLINAWTIPSHIGAVGLNQLYVGLNACYLLDENQSLGDPNAQYKVVKAESYILEWINKEIPEHSITILRGGPGSGKSSLMKKIARDIAMIGRQPVYFFSLQKFKVLGDLSISIINYLKTHEGFEELIIGESGRGFLRGTEVLIFDGLDELSNCGGIGTRESDSFVKLIKDHSEKYAQTKIIVSGRDYVMQKVAVPSIANAKALELLPFFIGEQQTYILSVFPEYSHSKFTGEPAILEANQRKEAVIKYYEAKDREIHSVPSEILDHNFQQLNRQPLMLYLLCELAFNNELKMNGDDAINKVYHRIFYKFWKLGSTRIGHEKLYVRDYLEMMECLAVCAWQMGEFRAVSTTSVRAYCSDERIANLLKVYFQHDNPFEDFLLTFFTRWGGRNKKQEDTIEFTHKSFCEFLVSSAICRFVSTQLEESVNQSEASIEEYLSLLGKYEITFGIWIFLKGEMSMTLRGKPRESMQFLKTLIQTLKMVCTKGFEVAKFNTSIEVAATTLRLELNLLLMITAISGSEAINLPIQAHLEKKIGAWLLSDYSGIFQRTMCYKEFPDNFVFPSIEYLEADFSKSKMIGAQFRNAVLIGVNFVGTELGKSNFKRVALQQVKFKSATLAGAQFVECEFDIHTFDDVDLNGIDFHECTLIISDEIRIKNPDSHTISDFRHGSGNIELGILE